MKRKTWEEKVLFFCGILIFVIVLSETEIYYSDIITNKCYCLLQGIKNGLSVFAIKSSLDIFDILEAEELNTNPFISILNHVYIVCYFVAPLITVKYFTQFLNYVVKEKLIDFNISIKKDRILFVGYNDYVEKLLKNTLNKNKDNAGKKSKILVLHKNDIPEKIRFRFQMLGVSFRQYEKLDYENEADRKMIFKYILPKKLKRIVLFEEKGMDNVSNYCFFLKCFEQEKASDFGQDLQIDCNYDLAQIEKLIWDCFDNKRDSVKVKYSMNTFSIPMLRVQSVLEKTKIYDNIIDNNGECKDIHLLIIGFGKMGRRFFKRAINESVVSEKNNIIVDVIEKDEKKIKQYIDEVHKDYYGSEENTVYIGSDVVEGDLQIRFHSADVNDNHFLKFIESISQETPFTYIAICIDNPEEGVTCMITIENYLQRKEQKVPVLFRMDSGQQLKLLEGIYNNLNMVPGDDEILSLENIRSNKLEEISKSIHEKDNNEQKNKVQVAYQIESRKYRVLHYEAKKRVYEKLSNAEKDSVKEAFGLYDKREKFINKIKKNKMLFKLGVIEHRRWSYYMILNGWSYGKEKDNKNKVTAYLCPFIKIINNDKLKESAYYEYKDWYKIISLNNSEK